ncbi:MAG TPA: cytochrome c [Terriglobales bacterium]|nr:cytochrome c [Terriglobales bacterium]
MKRGCFLLALLCIFPVALLCSSPDPKPAPVLKSKNTHTEWSVAAGEQRYRANCSRCHQAPPKFQPAAMATLVRHMRVRAMITDDDMHAILKYMTQ